MRTVCDLRADPTLVLWCPTVLPCQHTASGYCRLETRNARCLWSLCRPRHEFSRNRTETSQLVCFKLLKEVFPLQDFYTVLCDGHTLDRICRDCQTFLKIFQIIRQSNGIMISNECHRFNLSQACSSTHSRAYDLHRADFALKTLQNFSTLSGCRVDLPSLFSVCVGWQHVPAPEASSHGNLRLENLTPSGRNGLIMPPCWLSADLVTQQIVAAMSWIFLRSIKFRAGGVHNARVACKTSSRGQKEAFARCVQLWERGAKKQQMTIVKIK